MSIDRRGFLGSAIAASFVTGLNSQLNAQSQSKAQPKDKKADAPHPVDSGTYKRPIIVSANNGVKYLDDAFVFLKNGGDTLDAAIRVVKGAEDDPNDDTVGLGGLPNEEGVLNSMPVVCTDPRAVLDQSEASAISRMLRWYPKPSWNTPATSCWSAKARNDSRSRWVFRVRICSPNVRARSGCFGRSITPAMTGGGRECLTQDGYRPQFHRRPIFGRNA